MLAAQEAAALGEKNDKNGEIGCNGIQKTPEVIDGSLLQVGKVYQFKAGKLHNLNADDFIKEHSDQPLS